MFRKIKDQVLKGITRAIVRPYRAGKPPSKMVAIVVPLSNRAELLPEERVSLRHLVHYLGAYDKYLVAPKGLGIRIDNFTTIEFSRKYFGSVPAYNRLMYLPRLYELFRDYKYILMYHLDSLVFSDELMKWCETDLDYIGAPWLKCPELPWVTEPRVGNGGFALMKVEAVLQVLYNRYRMEPNAFWKDFVARHFARYAPASGPDGSDAESGFVSGPIRKFWEKVENTDSNRLNNDIFWGYCATRYFPEFRIPDWKTGLRFAFEVKPRTCFELNGGKLPFGCHAWAKYDRSFWEPYLLKA